MRRRRLFPLSTRVRSAPPPSPVVPEISVAPVIDSSAGNSVGDEISVSDGTWSNGPILEYAYRPTRGGTPIAGETANAYTLAQPADPGETIGYEVRARNADGWSLWATATGAVVCRPYWTAVPTFSGTNSVGGTFTGANGTVLGSTSTAYQWVRAAVETADSDPWPIVAGDEGLAFIWRGTGSNAGGDTDSDSVAQTVRPYWSVNPSIDVGSENWPGGTMTASAGTVDGETSGPTYEWLEDAVGTGDTDSSYSVPASSQDVAITYKGTASNAGGASDATSAPVIVTHLAGVERGGEAYDYLRQSAATPPDDGTLIVWGTAISASSGGCMVSWGCQPGANSTRREVAVFVTSLGSLQVSCRNSTSLGIITISTVITFDGTTPFLAGADWDVSGSALRATHAEPGSTITQSTTIGGSGFQDFTTSASTAVPTAFRREATLAAGGVAASQFSGTLMIAHIARRYTPDEWQDLADALESGDWSMVRDDPDLVWMFAPGDDKIDGDSVLVAADAQCATIVGGTADCTLGGLNVPI